MIKKLLQRVFKPKKKPDSVSTHLPLRIPYEEHGITRDDISAAAFKTTETLQKAGFQAFLVGGAVRDLLLDRTPKDYDVATDATPEEVNALFKRSRIIGRRFRLVHVMFGSETIEVSTFRGSHVSESSHSQIAESGRILRDNVFGNQEEDAERRDFSANALYFDPASEEIWDYHNGVNDIHAGMLRMIGDAETRYREDPVRMLRAVRLSAKLGLRLDAETEAPIPHLADLLADVPAARLFDEMLKLFLSGHAMDSAHALREHGLHHGLLPLLDVALEQPMGERFVTLALQNTDDRVRADKPVSPAFLFATLLWHEVLATWQKIKARGEKPLPALVEAMHQVGDIQARKLAITKRFSTVMHEIWMLQPRFEQRAGQRPFRLIEHPRFRAGYDFLLLRCQSGELEMEVAEWWEKFQFADTDERLEMLLPNTEPAKKRRRKKRPSGGSTPTTNGNEQE